MTLRILHVLDHSIPLQSGYAFRTRSIIREQRRMGWETFHLTSPKHTAPGSAEEIVDGIEFYRTSPATGIASKVPAFRELALMRATASRLAEFARNVKPDILHAHSSVLNAFPAIDVGRGLGIPVVYEVRAFWEDAAVDHGTIREWGPRYRLTRALETRALRRAAHVTTICEGLRRDIVARGIPEAKVTVIPNAVDVDGFEFGGEPDNNLKESLGLGGKTVVGFIGSFYSYEGLDLLIAALPRIVAKEPGVRLLLVGGGPEDASLRAQARRLGIADKVVFTGRVEHDEISRYYGIVDLFAYPRHSMRLTELVTPLKPLEAMAHGRVLVASDVGGHRELIRDGETGVLFRAGDVESLSAAVVSLLGQRQRWNDFRANARRYVEEERSWAHSASGYRRVFDMLRGTIRQPAAH